MVLSQWRGLETFPRPDFCDKTLRYESRDITSGGVRGEFLDGGGVYRVWKLRAGGVFTLLCNGVSVRWVAQQLGIELEGGLFEKDDAEGDGEGIEDDGADDGTSQHFVWIEVGRSDAGFLVTAQSSPQPDKIINVFNARSFRGRRHNTNVLSRSASAAILACDVANAGSSQLPGTLSRIRTSDIDTRSLSDIDTRT
ncbi:hypothetical protein CF319_g8448 [Tilletia indica]|nr:hypothetical protein CF319_g8448 [Tilletia indica]